jgi:hypothetical protein
MTIEGCTNIPIPALPTSAPSPSPGPDPLTPSGGSTELPIMLRNSDEGRNSLHAALSIAALTTTLDLSDAKVEAAAKVSNELLCLLL